jgi:hypothetical protein
METVLRFWRAMPGIDLSGREIHPLERFRDRYRFFGRIALGQYSHALEQIIP